MRIKGILAGLAGAALVVSGLAASAPSATARSTHGTAGFGTVRACTPQPAPGYLSCFALALAAPDGTPVRSRTPLASGFTPSDVQAAYNLKGLKSGGRTVAIVDAYGYSGLEKDLAMYRKTFKLPPCTTKNGCLTILDQNGGHHYPDDNAGWDLEQALDVDSVSATCPDCKIVVVEAYNASAFNLGIAVNQAAMQKGVVAISNSFGGNDRHKNTAWNHRGIAITASTGDSGFQGGQYPASDSHVVAVSGTSVTRDGSKRGYSEAAWPGTGSGCAADMLQPKWQQDVKTTCTTRAIGDVSAAADPNLGGLSIVYMGQFEQVGGTSEASPIIASVYALSGDTRGYPGKLPYERPQDLYDITTGSNGSCGPPLCDAGKGWDGPTGIGTPNGVKGF